LAKQLIFDETARRSLKRGIDRRADAGNHGGVRLARREQALGRPVLERAGR